MDMFGEFAGKRRFNTYDLITIPHGSIGYEVNGKKITNSNPFVTTVGRWGFNIFFIYIFNFYSIMLILYIRYYII